jgi:hypothetical protein
MDGGAYVALKSDAIYDMASFMAESWRALGLPSDVTPTPSAWIDCLMALRVEPQRLGVRIEAGELLELELGDYAAVRERAPDVTEALASWVAAVNRGFIERGEAPAIALILS